MDCRVTESVQLTPESRVTRDPKSGEIVISRVKFLGPRSTNKNPDGTQNVYALESRQRSVGLYEGAAVFVNHDRTKQERRVEDKVGRLRNCQAEATGNYGDLRLNPKHPLAERVAWDAEHSPDSLGLSHDAQGRARVEGSDRHIEVTRVSSVDIVCGGATTTSLFESLEAPMDPKPADKPAADKPPAGAPAPAKPEPKPEPALSVLEERLTRVEEELKSERVKRDELQVKLATRERKDRVEQLLQEAKLPAHAVTDVFREQLMSAADDAAAQKLIEDRRRISWHSQPNTRPAGADPAAKPIESQADFLASVGGKGK